MEITNKAVLAIQNNDNKQVCQKIEELVSLIYNKNNGYKQTRVRNVQIACDNLMTLTVENEPGSCNQLACSLMDNETEGKIRSAVLECNAAMIVEELHLLRDATTLLAQLLEEESTEWSNSIEQGELVHKSKSWRIDRGSCG